MDTLNKTLNIAREIFQDSSMSPESPIDGTAGYDSMAIAQFVLEIEFQFEVELSEVDVSKLHNVAMYVVEIKKRKG